VGGSKLDFTDNLALLRDSRDRMQALTYKLTDEAKTVGCV